MEINKETEKLGNEIAEIEEDLKENTKDSKYQRTKRGALERRRRKLEELEEQKRENEK